MMLLSPVEELLNAMGRDGWAASVGFLSDSDSMLLIRECEEAWSCGNFCPAGVGKDNALEVREEIRRDQVMWLDPRESSVGQGTYLAKLENLRLALNRSLFLGLFDLEAHFAVFQEGAFYKPHRDRHVGSDDRIVTVILYLNPTWQPGDGGELKLWTSSSGKQGPFILIEPRMGTLVCFMAGDFWHEVLPATKRRTSITGWFRKS